MNITTENESFEVRGGGICSVFYDLWSYVIATGFTKQHIPLFSVIRADGPHSTFSHHRATITLVFRGDAPDSHLTVSVNMAPKGKDYDTDWVWCSTSNVHVAAHRDWFISFTAFSSTITSGGETYAVEGIGDVTLDVRRMIGAAAKAAKNKAMVNSTIILRGVLYVPTFMCNVMGEPVRQDYSVSIGVDKLLMDKDTGRGVGLLERNEAGLTKVILKGQAKGHSSFKKDDVAEFSVTWADKERKKWAEQSKA